MEHLHFHDLRHTGNTFAASTGASTKELMVRMGHASARAALIYQHATEERDVAIAEGLSAMVEKELGSFDDFGGHAVAIDPLSWLERTGNGVCGHLDASVVNLKLIPLLRRPADDA
jgi:hypothetical protein